MGFFRAAQLFVSDTGSTAPFECVDVADMVDVEDAVEAMLELEFWRERFLRGPNILISSVHPSLVVAGWNEEATAVIGGSYAAVRLVGLGDLLGIDFRSSCRRVHYELMQSSRGC